MKFVAYTLCTCFFALISNESAAQLDSSLFQLLRNNLYPVESGNIGIEFEKVCITDTDFQDVKDENCFSGGHFYLDSNKMEAVFGPIKFASDGILTVIIDELSKNILIDSLDLEAEGLPIEATQFLDTTSLVYSKEIVANKNYRTIELGFSNGNFTRYRLTLDNNPKLIGWSDYSESGVTHFVIETISKSPVSHNYNIYLPNTPLENFHGYSVLDFRFSNLPSSN